MLKIFSWLLGHMASVEQQLANKTDQRLKGRQSAVFLLSLALVDVYLLLLEVTVFVMRFFIILFLDSGQGFDAVFKQKRLASCPHSYSHYKFKQKKLRTYSTGTLVTMVLAVSIVSIVMNLLFSDKLTGWAQTFSWTQTTWTTGASSTAIANHTANQTNWTRFASSTTNIATTTGGAITLTASSVVAIAHTSDADFNTFTRDNNIYIASGSARLSKPFGASCTTDTECSDGVGGTIGGWCYNPGTGSICTNPFIANICTSTLDNPGSTLGVMRKDLASTYKWRTTQAACDTPQCGQNGGQNGDNLVASNTPDFSLYLARNACKAIGGRLPTMTEMACIYTNRTNYNIGGAFQNNVYWSATEYDSWFAWNINLSNGTQYSTNASNYKDANNYVRCVKAQ